MAVSAEVLHVLDAVAAGGLPGDLESETLDFKTQGRSVADTLRDLAEAAACLANSAGGSIIVGVADGKRGPTALVGTDLDGLKVKRRIFELTDPRLTVGVDELTRTGRRLLVITVPSSPDVHAVGGRSTERIGTSCEPMSNSRIASVVAERRGDDWSADDSTVPIGEADPVALDLARSMLGRSSDARRGALGRASDPDLLRGLGLVTPQRTLVNAGALLFCGDGGTAQLTYVHRRTPAGALVVNEPLTAPLLRALERAFELVDVRSDRTSVNLPGGQQIQLADLPPVAVREALVNAVMHRDYRRPEAVHVEHTATRLVVTSPGPFVTGVTVHNVLTTSPRSRNPLLAGAIRMLGLAETAGAGVDRMYAEMARLGHQPPTFTADADHVRVTLLGGAPNTFVARFVSTLPSEESEDADTMLTLLTLLGQRTVTAAAMAPLLQKPEPEAQAVLDRLSSEAVRLLERTRESAQRRRPVYRLREHVVATLGPALTYRRRTLDEYDRKIIGVVREAGEVNARMVRLLLDLDAAPASRVLADLVERGILVKTSQAQRGPSVAYGPGPAFPKQPRGRRRAATSEEGA
ncbi:MAG: ATP-binding protein [Actinomycetota bacterium]